MPDSKSELITEEQLEILEKLFDPEKKCEINTDEDLIALGEIFDEDE